VALAAALGVVAVIAGTPGSVAVTAQPSEDPRGREVYLQRCASCHGPAGEGTQRGPSVAGVGAASVDFQLRTGRMPLAAEERYRAEHQDPELADADIRAVVDYVEGLAPGGPEIPAVRSGNTRLGLRLFLDNCAACHSATGRGGTLTDGSLVPSLFEATPTQVGEAIRVGPGLMPAYPESVLGEDDVDALAGYVDLLQGEHGDVDRGGVALDRVGPVAEGVVAWAVGLLLLVLVVRKLGSRTR
jgi:ubiquinol-cytochrome c reductase cytochrome c subunit